MRELRVHEFHPGTIQGEGTHAGRPADFLRLYGCPVGCWFCDTGYSAQEKHGKNIKWHSLAVEDLIGMLTTDLVVITGGEPFMDEDLPPLCQHLISEGHEVAIETSGAKWRLVPEAVWITLSPKEHISKKWPVCPAFWRRANEIKLIISAEADLEFYSPRFNHTTPVFLQPEHSKHEEGVSLIREHLIRHPRHRLSLQTHKFINVP